MLLVSHGAGPLQSGAAPLNGLIQGALRWAAGPRRAHFVHMTLRRDERRRPLVNGVVAGQPEDAAIAAGRRDAVGRSRLTGRLPLHCDILVAVVPQTRGWPMELGVALPTS